MKRLAFEDQDFFVFENPKTKIEPGALHQGRPQFDGQDIVVARGRLIAQMTFDDGEKRLLRLQFEQRDAEVPEKFAARGFENIQITRVINVIADGAIGINHAMDMVENPGGHGHHCNDGVWAPPRKKVQMRFIFLTPI